MATSTKATKDITARRKAAIKTVGKIHDNVLETSDELIEGVLTTGAKWQELMAKAIKNSKPLMSKQVDIMFDGVEVLQGQYAVGSERFKKLFGIDPKKVTAQVEKTVKAEVKSAKATVKKTVRKARKTVKKATSKK